MISEEQEAYIKHVANEDTKLLATAGSGKTFCIIHHIDYLVTNRVYQPSEIIVLTFSKNARDDFINKLRKYGIRCINRTNVFTIDSLAWNLLGNRAQQTDVAILSYTLMLELETMSFEEAHATFIKLTNVKCVFIDEAQDLNETQYRLLLALKKQFSPTLHFVGDPNQNIFQFRNASDKHLINHQARAFYLTKNYRSQGHIVEFCSALRPYSQREITYEHPKGSLDIMFYAYDNNATFENQLLAILRKFREKKIPLHKCAILAPTRGYVKDARGVCKYKGLCYISNLLYTHSIPFVQFYSDTNSSSANETADVSKIKYKPVKDHMNLMTYTSSKGLEWDYVIIIDANAHLISPKDYTCDKFDAERYLLYVACSRPRKNLIIFTKQRYANPWFKNIPLDKYKVARVSQQYFDFFDTSKLYEFSVSTQQEDNPMKNITVIVNALDEPSLYRLNTIIHGKYKRKNTTMFDGCMVDGHQHWKLRCSDARKTFLGKFMEHICHVYADSGKSQEYTHLIIDVKNVVESSNVLLCDNERIIHWYYQNRAQMTWETFDKEKSTLKHFIVNYVENYFDRAVDFGSYTLVDKFYNTHIIANKEKIKAAYIKYLADPGKIESAFYMSLVAHAIQTTHYFYIHQYAEFAKDILEPTDNAMAFELMKQHFEQSQYSIEHHYYRVNGEKLYGLVDFVINHTTLAKVRFSSDTNLKDIITMMTTCILYGTSHFMIFNMLNGVRSDFEFSLSDEDQMALLACLE